MRSASRRRFGKDPAYLEWLHTLPCLCCWGFPGGYQPSGTCLVYWEYERLNGNPSQGTPTEAAHVGLRGLSQKCPDREAIPLCREHHTQDPFSSHRMGKKFWEHYGIDRDALIQSLNRAYKESNGTKD